MISPEIRPFVAEQVAVAVPTNRALDVMTQWSPDWAHPMAILAWNEGQRFLGLVEPRQPMGPTSHTLELGRIRPAGQRSVGDLTWRVEGASHPFVEMQGLLAIAPCADGTVISLVGTYDGPTVDRAGAARTPTEIVVRSLLGHARNAVLTGVADANGG